MTQIVGLLLIVLTISGCGVNQPKPEFCQLKINENGTVTLANCIPTAFGKTEYDKSIDDMYGYTCTSPKDTNGMLSYLEEIITMWKSKQIMSYAPIEHQ